MTALSNLWRRMRGPDAPDAMWALSLANLYFLGVWAEILPFTYRTSFFRPAGPECWHYLAAIVNVAALAAIFFAAARAYRTSPAVWRRWIRRASLVAVLVPLKNVQTLLAGNHSALRIGTLPLAALVLLIAAAVLIFALCDETLTPVLRWAVLCLFALAPIDLSLAAWGALHARATAITVHAAAPAGVAALASKPRRVVWIVFDEWDYRLTFEARPAMLELPELDRFTGQSLSATHAFSPGGRTMISVPALLAGRMVRSAGEDGKGNLMVGFADAPVPSRWSSRDLPFDEIAASGGRSGVVGWYFPYALIAPDADAFTVETNGPGGFPAKGAEFFTILANQWRSLAETQRLSPFGQTLTTMHHREAIVQALSAAVAAAADPRYTLVFLHLPIPHAPYFYDRRTQSFGAIGSAEFRYRDNLALVDRALGRIRSAMAKAGVWDNSAVLLSSDHWYRSAPAIGAPLDHRVPFLLKLPGETRGLSLDQPFNTVLSRALIFEVLGGRVSDPAAASLWLDRHRSLAESPYNAN